MSICYPHEIPNHIRSHSKPYRRLDIDPQRNNAGRGRTITIEEARDKPQETGQPRRVAVERVGVEVGSGVAITPVLLPLQMEEVLR